MKLFDYYHHKDYGHEWYFQVLTFYPKFTLIDCVIQWDEYPAVEWVPYLIVGFGANQLCGFSFRWRKFQIRCDIISFYPRNLKSYKRTCTN